MRKLRSGKVMVTVMLFNINLCRELVMDVMQEKLKAQFQDAQANKSS